MSTHSSGTPHGSSVTTPVHNGLAGSEQIPRRFSAVTASGLSLALAAISAAAAAPALAAAEGSETSGNDVEIQDIRGEAGLHPSDSPMLDDEVTVSGFVTGHYADADNESRAHDGFYIQQEGACGGEDYSEHEVSCAIFVYMGTDWDGSEVAPGDYVDVTGIVDAWQETGAEESAQLQLTDAEVDVETPTGDVAEPLPYPYEGFIDVDEREQIVGMLTQPTGDFTVTDNYGLLHGEPDDVGGVLGVVDGDEALQTPTSHMDPGEQAQELADQNAERYITLGHGGRNRWADWAFDRHMPLPYLHSDQTVRVGAPTEFTDPVILEHRYDSWRFEPRSFLPGNREAEPVDIGDTRHEAELPERAGDLRLAGFNVLNYFPHTGEDDPECEGHFTDRHGEPTTTDDCTQRGAYLNEHFDVQQARIVNTIVEMDADVVALQEVENSAAFGEDRDFAHQQLIDALNAVEGEGTWEFVPVDEHPEDEDVIRNGFIYQPSAVELVDSVILFNNGVEDLDSNALEGYDLSEIYSNAREPMAAIFQPVDGTEDDQFSAVVNHLKSKGCDGAEGDNDDQGDGQSCFNADRIEQSEAMVSFTEAIEDHYGLDNHYLMGDFNSHAYEDPMQEIYEADYGGYTNLTRDQSSYMFSGELGALDHMVASSSAAKNVEQAKIWNTNAREPIALEYSRYEAAGIDGLYDSEAWNSMVWRASDHDPIIADITVGAETPETEPSG